MHSSDLKIIAFDTSSPVGEIAAVTITREGERVALVRELKPTTGFGGVLATAFEALLGELSWEAREVNRLAVCLGPGSFAGTRVGLSFAKGFALATGTAVVGVTAPQALFWGRDELMAERMVAVIDAGRGHAYVAIRDETVFGTLDEARRFIRDRVSDPVLVGSGATLLGDLGAVLPASDRVRAETLVAFALSATVPEDTASRTSELVPSYVQPPRITSPRAT